MRSGVRSPVMRIALNTLATGVLTALSVSGAAAQEDRSIFSVLDTGGRSIAVATIEQGSLSSADMLSAGGRRIQVWSLGASPGDEIQVDLRSDDFDAFLYVVGPGLGEGLRDDDGGNGLDARLCMVLTEAGEYRVVASSLGGGLGDFALEIRARPGATDGVCPTDEAALEITDLAELSTDSRTLQVGDDVEGFLSSADPIVFGAPAQAWAVQGRAGAPFSVDLISDDFDAYLMVQGPGLDEWLQDDDGAGGCDSRLTFTFPEDGLYRVVVSSLGESPGSFRLVASAQPGPLDPRDCMALDTPAQDSSAGVVDVTVGEDLDPEITYDGTMTGDEGTVDGRSMQAWTLPGRAGSQYVIDLRSDDFDSYLYLSGPGFPDLIYDDDGGDNLDSRICVELPDDGEYIVFGGPLSGASPGGRFTIRASMADAPGLCPSFTMSPGAVLDALASLPTEGRRIGVGQELEGFMDADGPRHPDADRTIQAWALDVPEGLEVYVDIVSNAFDPVLYVVGPGIEEALFADDSGAGCNARQFLVSGGAGTVLLPGAYYSGGGGPYLLRVSTNPPPLEAGGCISPESTEETTATAVTTGDPGMLDHLSSGTDRRLSVGTEAEGSLGFGDEALLTDQPAQAWTVDVRAGDELVFELLSDAFDPVLYLDAGGTLGPVMDDDGAGNLDSRIVFTATLDTTIRLVVTALTTDGSGSFRLRAIRRVR